MIRTVYKYTLTDETTTLHMPQGAQILCVQVQYGEPQLWALVDLSKPLEKRAFLIYGTGQEIKGESLKAYCGTFQLSGGQLVFHVFEIKKGRARSE